MLKHIQTIHDSKFFQNAVIVTILSSTLLVGLETLPYIQQHYLPILARLDSLILVLFSLELLIRIAVYGARPWRFFSDVWNIFDFLIVAVCYLPSGQFASALRLVRVLRVLRLLSSVQRAEIEHLKNVQLQQAYAELETEKARSERLLLNILPQLIASRLKDGAQTIADNYPDATVLFADLVGFTQLSSKLSPESLVEVLDDVFCRFDLLAEKHQIEKIKTIGDAYMAVSGVPQPDPQHLQHMANMALEIPKVLAALNQQRGLDLQIRVGLHCGKVIAGIIGHKKFIYDLWGDTVNIASRMESHGIAGQVQVSDAVQQRLQSQYHFKSRGAIDLKGKGMMHTYFLLGCKDNN